MRKKLFLLAGVLLILVAITWKFLVYPNLNIQQPVNYSIDFDHDEDNRFAIGGSWSGDVLSFGRLAIKTVRVEGPVIYIDSDFKVVSINDDPLFDLQQKFAVDRKTRLVLPSSGFRNGSYYAFPPKLKKTNYLWVAPTIGGSIDVRFVDELKIQGLTVYHFRGQEENLDDTNGFGFLPLVPEEYKISSRALVDVYVEPRIGLIIYYEDHKTSSYVDDKGNRVWDMSTRSNRTNSQVVNQRVKEASRRIRSEIFLENGVALILLLLGSILLVFRSRPKRP